MLICLLFSNNDRSLTTVFMSVSKYLLMGFTKQSLVDLMKSLWFSPSVCWIFPTFIRALPKKKYINYIYINRHKKL